MRGCAGGCSGRRGAERREMGLGRGREMKVAEDQLNYMEMEIFLRLLNILKEFRKTNRSKTRSREKEILTFIINLE